MSKAFHDKPFDPATKIKLEIFRRYVREWLPVFLTKPKDQRKEYSRVNIYDLFSGPGRDVLGVSGSPLIVQEEIKAYCQTRGQLKANIPVRMVFNDINADNVAQLKQALQENRCSKDCCAYEFHTGSFAEALARHLSEMRRPGDANLVILDQCGVTEVVPQTVKTLVECGTTDVLFFISSSFLRRFAAEPEMQTKFAISPDLPKIEENDTIHRFICQHFRDGLNGTGIELAPFSLKKGPNVYGVIFAATHLSGLERFLSVCWKIDPHTGEANFNIERDPAWAGQELLFADPANLTKIDRFERDLLTFITDKSPNNLSLYRFCLEQGFPATKANEALRRLQEKGKLQVVNALDQQPARKGSFYIKEDRLKVVFKSSQP
jgi:three-Cys-motif partner protein